MVIAVDTFGHRQLMATIGIAENTSHRGKRISSTRRRGRVDVNTEIYIYWSWSERENRRRQSFESSKLIASIAEDICRPSSWLDSPSPWFMGILFLWLASRLIVLDFVCRWRRPIRMLIMPIPHRSGRIDSPMVIKWSSLICKQWLKPLNAPKWPFHVCWIGPSMQQQPCRIIPSIFIFHRTPQNSSLTSTPSNPKQSLSTFTAVIGNFSLVEKVRSWHKRWATNRSSLLLLAILLLHVPAWIRSPYPSNKRWWK